MRFPRGSPLLMPVRPASDAGTKPDPTVHSERKSGTACMRARRVGVPVHRQHLTRGRDHPHKSCHRDAVSPSVFVTQEAGGNCRMVGRGGPRVSVSLERGFFAPLGLAILGSNDARLAAGVGIPPRELLVARRDRRTGCATANDQGTGIPSDKVKRAARDGKRPARAGRRRGCAYERTYAHPSTRSAVLSALSLQIAMGRAGFEPVTLGLKVRPNRVKSFAPNRKMLQIGQFVLATN
jgi:hypothetical protein